MKNKTIFTLALGLLFGLCACNNLSPQDRLTVNDDKINDIIA
jgi:hypothetical protein